MGNRHFNEVKFGSGLVMLSFFGLKVKMLIKEFEMICKMFKKFGLELKALFPPYFFCCVCTQSAFIFKQGRAYSWRGTEGNVCVFKCGDGVPSLRFKPPAFIEIGIPLVEY